MSETSSTRRDDPAPARARRSRLGKGEDDRPVLPTISRDESEVGWGDEPSGRDADWYERERPPHHG